MTQLALNEGVINIVSAKFIQLSGSERGSSIYQDNQNSRLHVNYCEFIKCKATQYSGGVCCQQSSNSSIAMSCFVDNEAQLAPAFMLWSNGYNFLNGYVYESSEVSLPSYHSCGFGGRAHASYKMFNSSHFKTSTQTYYNYCLTGYQQSEMKISFLVTYNSTSPSIFGIYGTNVEVKKSMFIKCNADCFSKFFSTGCNNLGAEECVIYDCSIKEVKDASLSNCQVNNPMTSYIESLVSKPSFFMTHTVRCNLMLNIKSCKNNRASSGVSNIWFILLIITRSVK